MACNCGCSPCCCGGQNPTVCCTPTTESVEYTAENVNLIGVGVLNGTTGTNFEFRGIASDTLALTVTLDAPNNAIIISFNDELLIDDIPTFTETIRGIGEAATQAETNAGVSDNTIVTPLKLGARTATETRAGIAEIATQAEVTTGTDDTRIITPLKLATFAGTQFTTRTFADAVARAAATPAFDGQIGVQLDTNALIVGTGTNPGDFTPNIVVTGTLNVTGEARFAAGNVATPGIAFTSDTDLGLYRVGANQIAVAASGARIAAFAPGEINFDANAYGVDGGPSTPTFGFTSSSETGIYLPLPGNLGLTADGVFGVNLSSLTLTVKPGINLEVPSTITAGGVTGAQVINKMSGSVNFAAGASTLVVTNSLVTTQSIVIAIVATNDATMKTVSVTQTAGSFTLTANASATAETRVNFFVTNPSS